MEKLPFNKNLTQQQLDKLNELISTSPPIQKIAPKAVENIREAIKVNAGELISKYSKWAASQPEIEKWKKSSMSDEPSAEDETIDQAVVEVVSKYIFDIVDDEVVDFCIAALLAAAPTGAKAVNKERISANARIIAKDQLMRKAKSIKTI